VLPLVGRVEGAKLFLSDLRLYNPGPQERTFSLFYVARGQNGAVRATHTVPAGRVLALDDVIGTEYGYADSLGQLTLLSSDARFLASSRASTRGASGSFGVLVPAADSAAGFGQGQTSTVSGLASDARRHVNAGFAEVSGAPVSVRMDLLGGDGAILGSTTRSAGANGAVFATDIAGDHGPSALSNLRIDFTVTSGAGRIAPFAILVDGATGDGAFQAAASPQLSAEDLVIAQASHATGANADFFRTDLHVTNLGDAPATVTLSLIPRTLTGAAGVVPVHTIAPGQTLEALDVLAGQFGLADPSAAGLRIHPGAPARLHVATRTSVEGFGGSFASPSPESRSPRRSARATAPRS
jgi:hypothetical protein